MYHRALGDLPQTTNQLKWHASLVATNNVAACSEDYDNILYLSNTLNSKPSGFMQIYTSWKKGKKMK